MAADSAAAQPESTAVRSNIKDGNGPTNLAAAVAAAGVIAEYSTGQLFMALQRFRAAAAPKQLRQLLQ